MQYQKSENAKYEKDMKEHAILHQITTDMVDKETNRQIHKIFQDQINLEHEQRLIAERKAREEAENEIARLREENAKAQNKQIEVERLAREEAEKEI